MKKANFVILSGLRVHSSCAHCGCISPSQLYSCLSYPLLHPSCCGGFSSSSNFQLWVYKKNDGRNVVDEHFIGESKTLSSIHQCQRALSRSPQLATWHPSRRSKWNWHSCCFSQCCSFRQSIFNPQPTTLHISCVKFLMWFSSVFKTKKVGSNVTFDSFIASLLPTGEYLKWWLHRIIVWPLGIMRFLGRIKRLESHQGLKIIVVYEIS